MPAFLLCLSVFCICSLVRMRSCAHVFAGLYVYLNMFLHGYGCVCARVTVCDKAEGGMGIHF